MCSWIARSVIDGEELDEARGVAECIDCCLQSELAELDEDLEFLYLVAVVQLLGLIAGVLQVTEGITSTLSL
jgi:hypothetical protein